MERLSDSKYEEENALHKRQLTKLVGRIPNNNKLIKTVRAHQGWWRAFVLGLPEGEYLSKNTHKMERVCNRTHEEQDNAAKNFLTTSAVKTAQLTLKERNKSSGGKIEIERLWYNLLSSQPLCFNFFGELMFDTSFGLKVLQTWWPNLTELVKVEFEYSPPERFTGDNSAFDIALKVKDGEKRGLIGLECKYTDTFSFKPKGSDIFYGDKGNKNHDTYLDVFDHAVMGFTKSYYDYVKSKDYNQLFRNQLIAESQLDNDKYDFVYTGLFCFEKDESAIQVGKNFQRMLAEPERFSVITYQDFISKVQGLELNWEQREWTMLLWARYCATQLSEPIHNTIL